MQARSIILLLVIFTAAGASVCGPDYFPCDDGYCVEKSRWCDSREDCPDDSDERYCSPRTAFLADPNHCTHNYFLCHDGRCIPITGVCDGLRSCDDNSDEENCTTEYQISTEHMETKTTTTTPASTTETSSLSSKTLASTVLAAAPTAMAHQPLVLKIKVNGSETFSHQSDSVHVKHEQEGDTKSKDDIFDSETVGHYLHVELFKARDWLLKTRDDEYGWKGETARALTALHYADDRIHDEEKMLMQKQLHLQLSVAMLRNNSDPIDLSELALYINALLATCSDPKNFHSTDLVEILRQRTNVAQQKKHFVSPLVYITLCMNDQESSTDREMLRKEFHTNTNQLDKVGVLALMTLAAVCHSRSSPKTRTDLDKYAAKVLRKIQINGLPGNIYDLALTIQALTEANVNGKFWNRTGALSEIGRSQLEDGSFGDILSTYYTMPVLAGTSLLHVHSHCPQKYSEGYEEIIDSGKDKMYIQYSLYFHSPMELAHTLQMKVPITTTLLEVMKLAARENSIYSFKLEESKGKQNVYYLGNKANDAERGLYWTLHTTARNVTADSQNLAEFNEDIRSYVPANGLHIVFWFKRLE